MRPVLLSSEARSVPLGENARKSDDERPLPGSTIGGSPGFLKSHNCTLSSTLKAKRTESGENTKAELRPCPRHWYGDSGASSRFRKLQRRTEGSCPPEAKRAPSGENRQGSVRYGNRR